jgi:predicted permease
LRIPLQAGRLFTEDDRTDAEPVVIINESIARRHFPNMLPVGQRLNCGDRPRRIVGVVGDVRPGGFRSEAGPTIYFPLGQSDWGRTDLNVIVRTHGPSETLFAPIRRQMLAAHPGIPIQQASTLDELLSGQVAPARFNMHLLSLFGALALILASVGVYGLMAFFVAQRTREIGIRMALGAAGRDVLNGVLKRGLALTLAGVAVGLAGALALTRIMTSLLFDIKPTDPFTFACVSCVLIGAALLACFLPARRAAKIDPMQALRYE